jgi:hypothetical protein
MCSSKATTGAEMKTLKRIIYSFLAGTFGLGFVSLHATTQPKLTARLIGEVAPSTLPESGNDSRIKAFDVAPDGSLLAVLYWPSYWRTSLALSVAIWDIRSKAVIRHAQIGVRGVLVPPVLIDDQVIFTSDEKYLVVLGLGKVWILDANTCAVVRSIDSPGPELGPPVHILKAGGSTLAVIYRYKQEHYFYKQQYNRTFYVALFEIPGAKMMAGWQSSAFPQSFSPDGKLAVGPDTEYNKGEVRNLLVMDAETGAKVKSIPVGFGFNTKGQRADQREPGSFTARFLDNEQIVVTPDNMVDHTGHHSGYSLEVINANEGRVVREITPKNFGPTGELTVSPDLSHFAVYSHYVSAWAKLSDGLWPDFHKPELLVFGTDDTRPELVIPDLKGGGVVAYLTNMVLPKLSNDASVVAVAQFGAIKVFKVQAP